MPKPFFGLQLVFDSDYYRHMQQSHNDEQDATFLINALHLNKEDAILDIGTGNGRILFELHKRGFSNLTGIEISEAVLSQARNKVGNLPINFILDDFLKYNFKNKYSKIFSFFTGFGYYSDIDNEKFIQKVAKILRQDGLFLLDLTNVEYIKKQAQESIVRDLGNVKYSVKNCIDAKTLRMHTVCDINDTVNHINKKYGFSYRYYSDDEIKKLFSKFSLKIHKTYGDYHCGELNNSSKRAIYIMRSSARN